MTLRANCVECVTPPPEPVTPMWKEPVGVDIDVPIVRRLEKPGRPDPGLKTQVAPVGNPLVQARVTSCVDPLSRLTISVLDAERPWLTVMLPEFEIEKSNGGAI